MARRRSYAGAGLGGFGSGFAQGFGLVQDYYDSENKKAYDAERLAMQREDLEGDRAFRDSEAERRSKEAIATQEFRTQQAQFNQDTKEATAKYRADDLKIKRDELTFKKDPTNPANIKTAAEAEKTQSEADARSAYTKKDAAALRLDGVYKAITSKGVLDEEDYEAINAAIEANKGSMFDIAELSSSAHADSIRTIEAFNKQLASGNADMSADVIQAYNKLLGLDDTANIGRKVDKDFANAPDWMQDGNHVVVGQGLYDVQLSDKQPKDPAPSFDSTARGVPYAPRKTYVQGRMYVLVENEKTGEVYPYFPPITSDRAPYQTVPLDIDFEQITQGSFALAHMSDQIAPAIKEDVRRARIMQKFGSTKDMSSGVKEFNEAVEKKVQQIRQGIQGGGDGNDVLLFLTADEVGEMRDKQMSEENMETIRQRVEDNILFGTVRTPPQENISRWVGRTAQTLQNTPLPKPPPGYEYVDEDVNAMFADGSKSKPTLGDVITFNVDSVAEWNGLSDNPRKLAQGLIDNDLIRKSQ